MFILKHIVFWQHPFYRKDYKYYAETIKRHLESHNLTRDRNKAMEGQKTLDGIVNVMQVSSFPYSPFH